MRAAFLLQLENIIEHHSGCYHTGDHTECDQNGGGTVLGEQGAIAAHQPGHGVVQRAAGQQGNDARDQVSIGRCLKHPCHGYGPEVHHCRGHHIGGKHIAPQVEAQQIHTPAQGAAKGGSRHIAFADPEVNGKAQGADGAHENLNECCFHTVAPPITRNARA